MSDKIGIVPLCFYARGWAANKVRGCGGFVVGIFVGKVWREYQNGRASVRNEKLAAESFEEAEAKLAFMLDDGSRRCNHDVLNSKEKRALKRLRDWLGD